MAGNQLVLVETEDTDDTHVGNHHALLQVTDILVIVSRDPFCCCFRLKKGRIRGKA